MSQLTLSLFETTALGGLTLGASSGRRFRPDPEDILSQTAAPAAVHVPAQDYRLTGARALARGWHVRAADNLAAIELMREIAASDRNATPEEQAILARFTGFGATELANTLFRRAGEAFRSGWEDLGNRLEQLASPAEMASLARSTQYAHYTPDFMTGAIWSALAAMGFKGGQLLEPGCGTGLFLAAMPEKIAGKSAVTAIEMEPLTAGIARLLQPNAWVLISTEN